VIYLPSDPKPQGYNGWRYLAINHDACGCGRAEGIDRYGNKVYDDWLCESHTKRAMDILKERNNERVFLQSRTGCIEQMHCLHDLSIRLYEPQSNSHKS